MQTLAQDSYHPPAEAMQLADVERCIARVLQGQADAWRLLMAELHPMAMQLCRYRLRGPESAAEDICRDVASKTLERLQRSNYAALRRYQETRRNYPSLRFTSWLRTVVGNVCIDHVRTLPGHQRGGADGARHHQIQPTQSLRDEAAPAHDMQRHLDINRVLAWLGDPEFPSDQREALSLWMRGHDAAEIATALSLPTSLDATRLLRAGRQRLRRRFEER